MEAFLKVVSNPKPTAPFSYLEAKLKSIVFPSVRFQNATLEEAIEFIRIKSRDLDTATTDPAHKGVNIIIQASAQGKTARITLDLKDVPMSELLRYITELSQTKFQVAPFAILITSIDERR
jgi:general secretion pathway protein D